MGQWVQAFWPSKLELLLVVPTIAKLVNSSLNELDDL
jgi:hypothetical protein